MELLELLLDQPGIDVNLVSSGGGKWNKWWTVLMQACFLGHHNIVTRLCQVENIDVNFLDDDGYSALLLSVWNYHVEVVEALKLVKNVNWNVQSSKGKVPSLKDCEV